MVEPHSNASGKTECLLPAPGSQNNCPSLPMILVQPNGIVGTPDGKTLYVADIGGRKHGHTGLKKMELCQIKLCFAKWVPTA